MRSLEVPAVTLLVAIQPERHLVSETIYQAFSRPELGGLHRELPKAVRAGRCRRKPHPRGEERRAGWWT